MRPAVLVSHPADEPVRDAYRRALGQRAEPTFVADLDAAARAAAIATAPVLACFAPLHELPELAQHTPRSFAFVQCLAAGRDRFPFAAFRAAQVAFNPGAAAGPIAEHAVALLLAAAKNLLPRHRALARGEFEQAATNLRLRDAVAVVVGLGGIGREVARLLGAFGMRIRAINRSGRTDAAVERCGTLAWLPEALDGAQALLVCVELNDATRGCIGAAELARLRPDAVLVNVARAGVLREAEVFDFVRRTPTFRAGLDVWWIEPLSHGRFGLAHPWLDLPNVIGSPHNAASVPGILRDLAAAAAANIARHLAGEPARHVAEHPADRDP